MAVPENGLNDDFRSAAGISITDRAKWNGVVTEIDSKDNNREEPNALGADTLKLAYTWAKIMEKELKAGRTMDQVAWESFLKADDIVGGATGGMAKTATAHLGETWKYGKDLVDWHNRMAARPGTAPSMVGPIR
jgi:hypothetical protein